VLEALARLEKGQTKVKKIPMWKFNKRNKGDDGTDIDAEKPAEDPA
jgi:CD2 antigen cytoplasmic tail-binding protein 2